MPVVDINDHPLYFEDSGGSGPAVLFSHGFLMDHTMFAAQVEALSGEFRCITWDERGFGLTPARRSFTYWDSADDAVALLTHLGIERATLVGMSQGGFLSLRAALRAPERVAALVLIDTDAGTEEPATLAAYQAMRDEWLANGPSAVQDAVAEAVLGPGVEHASWFAKWEATPREDFALSFRCLAERDDITDRLGSITCPAIVFHGERDASIPMVRAEILRDRLPGCESLIVVEGGPHASNLSHPEQVNGPLLDFLRAHSLR